jgi:fucose 4-O-acetylase-like acetyltransferase
MSTATSNTVTSSIATSSIATSSITTSAEPVLSLDDLVDATPPERDRYVDFLRALSIVVVVCWHWVFSVTHWQSGRLSMPNPIGDVPLLWAATWVLQIMPLFFFVGGYANAASWEAVRRRGGGWKPFARRRLARLYRPLGAFLGLWAGFECLMRIANPDYPGVLHYGRVLFMPLWFLAVYTAVTMLTPATARLHRNLGPLALVLIGSTVALADLGRFRYGIEPLGWLNCGLVFLFAHQLGYFYRDGTLTRIGRRGQAAILLAALTTLTLVTAGGIYPHSMVSVGRDRISNMFPTTACIAVVAAFQVALAMLVRPAISRRLANRNVWRTVVAGNAVAMTVFIWHMTALLVVIATVSALGFGLATRPTTAWWLQRPLWLAMPATVLAGLTVLFARIERGGAR